MSAISRTHLFPMLRSVSTAVNTDTSTHFRHHVSSEVHLAREDLELLLLADRLHAGVVVRAMMYCEQGPNVSPEWTYLKCASSFP